MRSWWSHRIRHPVPPAPSVRLTDSRTRVLGRRLGGCAPRGFLRGFRSAGSGAARPVGQARVAGSGGGSPGCPDRRPGGAGSLLGASADGRAGDGRAQAAGVAPALTRVGRVSAEARAVGGAATRGGSRAWPVAARGGALAAVPAVGPG